MAKEHKAATQVQVARTEEESAFQSFVERYWMPGLAIFLLGAGFVVFRTYKASKVEEAASTNWGRLASEVEFGSGFSTDVTPKSPATLAAVAQEFSTSPLGGWAKLLETKAHLNENDQSAALSSLAGLEQGWPDHPAAKLKLPLVDDGTPEPLSGFVKRRLQALEAWKANHPGLFENPALPADAPKVLLKTSRGDLTLGLYQELAPRHCENFLKLCREGFYNGTKFHRVMAGFMVQGGDPNSKEGEPATWGLGGPGYKIDPESNDLRHFPHVLSAAKESGDTQSSGSQFFITTGAPHHLDGVHVVFGALVDGADVLEDISSAPVEGERPTDPVVIESAELL